MLYLVPTPIGNLSDITLRAVDRLKQCDLILCEDTRRSRTLMRHYGIAVPLKSYHQFNEKKREQELLSPLKEGKEIALISDAGTPGISDPGGQLVRRCREEGIPVTALPGASAAIVALAGSGLPADRFQFLGFPPKKEAQKRKLLLALGHYPGSSIFYESPRRLAATLKMMRTLYPERRLAVCRELTKLHEEFLIGTAEELLDRFAEREIKGEVVLILSPAPEEAPDEGTAALARHVAELQEKFSLSRKDAVAIVALLKGGSKRELHRFFNG